MAQSSDALWGGRFSGTTSDAMAALSKSTEFDWRLAKYDLLGTTAHVKALNIAGYLNDDELAVIQKAIAELTKRVEGGSFKPKPEEEDVHAALERGLIEIAGADVGGKVRTGRSRNDQIATLIRMFMADAADAWKSRYLPTSSLSVARQKSIWALRWLEGRTSSTHSQCFSRTTLPHTPGPK